MHANQSLVTRYFLVFCITLTVFTVQCRAADKQQSAWDSINTRLKALSLLERRSIVICVRGRFTLNYDKTVKHNLVSDAKNQLWGWKVYSRASVLMSRLAESAEWPEMTQYFRQEAIDSSLHIRGQIDYKQYVNLAKKNELVLTAALDPEQPRFAAHTANFQKYGELCTDASSQVISGAKLHALQ